MDRLRDATQAPQEVAALAGPGDVKAVLHAHEGARRDAEGFLDAQSHFRRQGGAHIKARRERRPGDARR